MASVEILMPELGESVHEGTVSRWLKQEGDFVKEDEPVVEIMTDKVNTELPAPATGVLTKILIKEGDPVEVFSAMGIIEEGATAGSTPKSEPKKPDAEAKADKEDEVQKAPPQHTPASKAEPQPEEAQREGRRWYTPVVRAMARDRGVTDDELGSIQGSGEGGRVTKKDLESYIASGRKSAPAQAKAAPKLDAKPVEPTVAGPDQELVPLQGMRKMIADHMTRSSQIPVVTTMTQVDVTAMVKFREANKESFQQQYGVKLTYTPFFLKAITEGLQEFPLLNASLRDDNQIVMNKGVHIGVAVALGSKGDEGLIVPVIRDCHKKSLVDLARDLDAIAKAARNNSLKPSDVQGGTFTLTNPGTYGALFGTPMINAPQAGILGAYAITKMPVVVDDMIGIRSIMHLVLTYDHRIVDGLMAGRFLAAVREKLQGFDFFK
jgi:pyruvate dehydrogenase E2 component (dihydrolipoamide acetyltransferase)